MLKSSKKRFLALLVSVLLVLSVTACGSNNSSTSASNSASASGSTAESNTSASSAMDTSPITMTLGVRQDYGITQEGVFDRGVFPEIAKQTGITLSVQLYDADKFQVLSAGGDLPEITMLYTDLAGVQSLASSGQILPLDDLLNQYGQNLVKSFSKTFDYQKKLFFSDGKTYVVAAPTTTNTDPKNPPAQGNVGFMPRYDIYKAIGSPKISSEDDFLNVLKQMQDYARANIPASKSAYALSGFTDWGLWTIVPYLFQSGYRDTVNTNYLTNCVTGQLENMYLDTNNVFWKAWSFINKAYRMGIFDPEGFTQKYQQFDDKLKNGEVLVSGYGWTQPDPAKLGNTAIFSYLPGVLPYVSVISPKYTVGDLSLGQVITTNCKNPGRAMQLMNYLASDDGAMLLHNGVKGVDWDIVDGKPQIIGERLNRIKAGTSLDYEQSIGIGPNNTLGFTIKALLDDGSNAVLINSADFLSQSSTEAMKSFAKDFDSSLSYPGQVYEKWVADGTEKEITDYPIVFSLLKPTSDEDMQIEASVMQYVQANIAKPAMAKSDAEFESAKADIIAAITKLGEDKANADMMANFAQAQQDANKIQ